MMATNPPKANQARRRIGIGGSGGVHPSSSSSSSSFPLGAVAARTLLWLLVLSVALALQLLRSLSLADAVVKQALLHASGAAGATSSSQQPQGQLPPAAVRVGGAPLPPPPTTTTTTTATTTTTTKVTLSLDELTRTSTNGSAACPPRTFLIHVDNVVVPALDGGGRANSSNRSSKSSKSSSSSSRRTIPPVLHQTSKSRCVTDRFAGAVEAWLSNGTDGTFSYYLHDDDAVMKLFHSAGANDAFPLLEGVAIHCATSGAIRADLWRYVALWTYGGVYADLDSVPGPDFDVSVLLDDTADAVFVVDEIGLLSQYFFAVAPNHPLMWYAVHRALQNLLRAKDTGRVHAPTTTGPHALHEAFRAFVSDGGGNIPPYQPGTSELGPIVATTYRGTHNRTVTAIGSPRDSDAFVRREIMKRPRKQRHYANMAMTHFSEAQQVASQTSCRDALRNHGYL